jgi:hypothetical protein
MNAVSNIMAKLSGAELGKLFLKDTVSSMQGQDFTYSLQDWETYRNRLDRSERYRFNDYLHFCEKLEIHVFLCWNARDGLYREIVKLNTLKGLINKTETLEAIRQLLTCERIGRDETEPGDTESKLIDWVNKYNEALTDAKDGISQIYTAIAEWLKLYFTLMEVIKGLSKRMELPELETIISDDTLSQIADLNTWAAELPEEYRDIFQTIDIDELAKVRLIDIDERINLLMSYIE